VHGLMLAAGITPDNTPHGYNWTFAFPMLLFIVISAALYVVLTRPHEVPGHGALPTPARGATAGQPAAGNVAAATAQPQATQATGATAVGEKTQTAEGPGGATTQPSAAESAEGPEDSE
jgi:hypothetical protein